MALTTSEARRLSALWAKAEPSQRHELVAAGLEEIRATRKAGKPPLPKIVFDAFTPLTKSVPIELCIFRKGEDGRTEVLMLQRADDDKQFLPGGWHVPGTMLWPDDSLESAIKRLLEGEVVGEVETPRLFGHLDVSDTLVPMRPAYSLLYAAQTTGTYDGKGRFFPVDNLPDNTLVHHKLIIRTQVDLLPSDFLS